MKELTFTHEGKTFTLDLEKGELTGDDPELLNLMHSFLKDGITEGCAGAYFGAFKIVKITDPYRDPYQFTACVIQVGYLTPIPEELKPYLPENYEVYDMEKDLLRFPEEERDEIRKSWQECPDYDL